MPTINYAKLIEQNSPQFKHINRTRQSIKEQTTHTQHTINCNFKQFSPRRSSLVTLRHTNNNALQSQSPTHTFYFHNVHKVHNNHQNIIDRTLQYLINSKKTNNQNKVVNNRLMQIKNKVRHKPNYTKLPSPKNVSQNSITLKPILSKINASGDAQHRNLSNKFSTYHLPNLRARRILDMQVLYDKLRVNRQEQIRLLPQIINRKKLQMVNAHSIFSIDFEVTI